MITVYIASTGAAGHRPAPAHGDLHHDHRVVEPTPAPQVTVPPPHTVISTVHSARHPSTMIARIKFEADL
jgi:hypothetical protein